MTNQRKPDQLYPLGPLENLMRQVYDHFEGEGATGVVVRISGDICDDALRQSIFIVQNRHPKLRCRFAIDDTGVPCFEVLDTPPPIPLKICESNADHLRWQEVTQDSFYPPMDTRLGPLMRMSLLRHKQHGICDLILVCHHAICDARSLLRLAHDILSAYQSVHNQDTSAKSVSLPLITASRVKLSLKLPHRIKTFLSCYRYIPQLRLKDWIKLPAGPDRYLPLWDRTLLSKSDTAMLLQKCRHFRTTVTGAMFAAGMIALGRMLKGNEHHIACRCPVNLITPSGYQIGLENIGCFVSTFVNIYAVNRKTDFWELARQAVADMKSFIDSQGPIMAFNMSHFLKFRPDRIPRRDNLSIDNLGIPDLHPQYGPLFVKEISVIGRRQFLGPSIMLIFCTVNGCLNITFDVVDIPRDFYSAYRNEVIRILESNI